MEFPQLRWEEEADGHRSKHGRHHDDQPAVGFRTAQAGALVGLVKVGMVLLSRLDRECRVQRRDCGPCDSATPILSSLRLRPE
ncbi:hypothetical protein C5O75_023600 [Burkholderia cepacia]|uniref:hypothetical protein n=1 Tax=Burkholderia cepacia TaxID=292 RepID=UPI0011B0BD0A|nr:hypothetical protein [Burkholderia cepacia]KAB1589467.1 hypothetical protein C5O75_023600 [Burkholderia cepacia]